MKNLIVIFVATVGLLSLASCDTAKSASATVPDMPDSSMSAGDMQNLLDDESVQMKLKEQMVNNPSDVRNEVEGFMKKNPDSKEQVTDYLKKNPDAKSNLMKFIMDNPELQKMAFNFIKSNPKILQKALALIGM